MEKWLEDQAPTEKTTYISKGLTTLSVVMATERVTRNRTGSEPLENRPGTGTVRKRFRIGPNRGTMKPPEKKR